MHPPLGRCPAVSSSSRLAPTAAARVRPFSRAVRQQFHQTPLATNVTPAASRQTVWIDTTNQAVLTAAVESGYSKVLFRPDTEHLAAKWQQLAAFDPLSLQQDGSILDAAGKQVGRLLVVASRSDLQAAEAAAKQPGYLIMDATDWKIIPAENLVAAFQSSPGQLLGVAGSAADARVMLEALETGTAGVLLRTQDPLQVKQLAAYVAQREAEGAPTYSYEVATVTRVSPVGMCDRVCVDLCSLLQPGQGMLVGSFARALFLVHSECMESQYINSRPFRVNAGAVHAYVQAPHGKTAYLSELKSGSEVVVADAAGRATTAVVGRCKIETRPMMLVEAETPDGMRHSTLLQNAETVRLVGPSSSSSSEGSSASSSKSSSSESTSPSSTSTSNSPGSPAVKQSSSSSGSGSSHAGSSSEGAVSKAGASQQPWRAVSVSELQPGQEVYLLRQGDARHTGISIQEKINEK